MKKQDTHNPKGLKGWRIVMWSAFIVHLISILLCVLEIIPVEIVFCTLLFVFVMALFDPRPRTPRKFDIPF